MKGGGVLDRCLKAEDYFSLTEKYFILNSERLRHLNLKNISLESLVISEEHYPRHMNASSLIILGRGVTLAQVVKEVRASFKA